MPSKMSQLSSATGKIAGMLNVLSIRLGRIVDRARIVEAQLMSEACLRIRLVNWSLRLFVCATLLVCLVIVTLFRTRSHELVRRDCRTVYLCHDADDRRATAVSVRGQRVDQPDTPGHRRDLRH